MYNTENYRYEILNIVFIQKRVILGIALFIFVLSIGIAFFWPSTYEVSSTLLVKNRQLVKNPQSIEDSFPRVSDVVREIVQSEIKVITSPELIRKTLEEMKNNGIILAAFQGDPDVINQEFLYVTEQLVVEVIPDTNMIKVSIRGRDAQWIKSYLDNHIKLYLAHRSSIYNPAGAEAFYQNQADRFKIDMRNKNVELMNLTVSSKVANPDKEIMNNLEVKKLLEQDIVISMRKQTDIEKTIQYIDKLLGEKNYQFFSSIDNKIVNQLAFKLQDLISERNNLQRLYTDENTKIVRVQQSIDATYKTIKQEVLLYKAGLLNQLEIEKTNITRLNSQIAELVKRNMEVKATQIQEEGINVEKDILKQSFQIFAKRTEEANVANTFGVDELFYIGVVSSPQMPVEPFFPRKKIVIPLGLLLGILIGFSAGFWLEFFDQTIKTPLDVNKFIDLPIIFSVPNYSKK